MTPRSGAQGVLDPRARRDATEPFRAPVDPAARGVVARVAEPRIDVPSIHADRRRAREAPGGGDRRIARVDVLDRRARCDGLNHLGQQGAGRNVVGAPLEPQELDRVAR